MRILYIHNFYTVNGGEDTVFFQEKELIGKYETVDEVLYYNQSGAKGLLQFFLSIWNFFSVTKLKRKIEDFKPDIIHIHNLHFAVGPLAIRVAKRYGIPVVVTLHNYRLICPSATLYFNGKVFTRSIQSTFPWIAIAKGVYRKSSILTFWVAFNTWVHKKIGTWNQVDNYIVLTDFAKRMFIASSFNIQESKFVVKSNFVKNVLISTTKRSKNFLFIGRLSEEKGIDVLLTVFKSSEHNLIIAGSGPLQNEVEKTCENFFNITYIGHLGYDGIQKQLSQCTALVFPSIWYEGMPMTILEAFANGTPVIASNLGAMETMIVDGYNGLHFEPNNNEDLLDKINFWIGMTEANRATYSSNSRETYLQYYTPENNLKLILNVYNDIYLK